CRQSSYWPHLTF
nr:immunoglobulin light chain junction region [Macaca mulatta]